MTERELLYHSSLPADPIDVGILMGSDSDIPIMIKGKRILDKFEIPYDAKIGSAHRTPEEVKAIVKEWTARGCKAIIAGAGWAAHLAGAVAAHTIIPVIGVPISSSELDGLDSLLSTVQMPPGIPVATVAIDCADNAAYLAMQILATSNRDLREALLVDRRKMAKSVCEKSKKLCNNSVWNPE